MQSKFEYTGPLIIVLAPDEDFTIVGGRCENVAIFGMCPGDRPNCAFMSGTSLVGCSKSQNIWQMEERHVLDSTKLRGVLLKLWGN